MSKMSELDIERQNELRDKKIDHEYTREIVCPYCGNEETNSYEYSAESDTITCDECGKKFQYSRDVEITYYTRKLCTENNQEHRWEPWDYHPPYPDNHDPKIMHHGFYHRECSECEQYENTQNQPPAIEKENRICPNCQTLIKKIQFQNGYKIHCEACGYYKMLADINQAGADK